MRKKEINQTGTINSNGELMMYMGEIKDFFQQNTNKRVIARFTIVERGTSEALRAYYYNVVVPTFKRALYDAGERLTEEQAEERMRQLSPVMRVEYPDHKTGKYVHVLKGISEISNAELIEHIDTIKQLCAEEYYVYIEDPRII